MTKYKKIYVQEVAKYSHHSAKTYNCHNMGVERERKMRDAKRDRQDKKNGKKIAFPEISRLNEKVKYTFLKDKINV